MDRRAIALRALAYDLERLADAPRAHWMVDGRGYEGVPFPLIMAVLRTWRETTATLLDDAPLAPAASDPSQPSHM